MGEPSSIPDQNSVDLNDDGDAVFVEGEVIDDLDGEPEAANDMSTSDEDDDNAEGNLPADVRDDSIHSFEGHTDAVLAVAWCPNSVDLVATGSQDERAFMWRVGQDSMETSGSSMGTLELTGHSDSVVGLAFNAAGTMLASAGMDGVVKVWSAEDGRLLHTLEGPGGAVEWVTWHPRGDVVLAGSEDFSLWMWNGSTGTCMQVFSGHRGVVAAGCFTPDGRSVISVGGEGDSSLRVWNPRTGQCSATISGHPFHEDGILCMALHPEGSIALSGGMSGSLCVSNVQTGRAMGTLVGHEESVEAVGFSGVAPLAVSAGMDGRLKVWDVSTSSERGVLEHPEGITRVALHPSSPLVYTSCLDGVVRCVDLRTTTVVASYQGHRGPIQDIDISPDGNMFIAGSDDGTAKVFDTRTRHEW